jgi:hypothetical protein
VRSNLRSHDGKPFDFEVAGAKTKILDELLEQFQPLPL